MGKKPVRLPFFALVLASALAFPASAQRIESLRSRDLLLNLSPASMLKAMRADETRPVVGLSSAVPGTDAKSGQPSSAGSDKTLEALGARAKPDFTFTPGKLCTPSDPDFKEYRYPEHIPYCNRHVTKEMKQQVAQHYGIPQSEWQKYEFDHLIPLGIGGDSRIDNLWPQPKGDPDGADDKDKLENELFNQLSAGTITQSQAVQRIYDWFKSR